MLEQAVGRLAKIGLVFSIGTPILTAFDPGFRAPCAWPPPPRPSRRAREASAFIWLLIVALALVALVFWFF